MDDEAASAETARERAHLFRHQLFFVVGLLLGVIGVATSRASPAIGGALLALAAASLLVSAASAMAGGRHLFGSVRHGGFGSNVTTPSGRDRVGAAGVAVGIAVVAVLLGVQAGRLLLGAQ